MWSCVLRSAVRSTLVTSRARRHCHDHAGFKMIKSFDKAVDPFSKIHIQSPMHVRICPVDLNTHPSGDWLTVSIMKKEPEGDDHHKHDAKFVVKQTQKEINVVGTGKQDCPDTVCVIRAPIRASFHIKATGKSNISIQDMHSDDCELKSATGSILLKNIRGKNILVRNDEGDVNCEGTLIADKIDIRTEAAGDVITEHIRANDLKVATNAGNISTESCYSESSHFKTVIGSLKLSNVHRNCVVEILKRGDLTVTGLDGTINAIIKRGNISLQASRLIAQNSIFIHESGKIDLKIPSDYRNTCGIELIGNKLAVDEEILKHGKMLPDPQHQKFRYEDESAPLPENDLHVECRNGTIELTTSSWQSMIESETNGKNK